VGWRSVRGALGVDQRFILNLRLMPIIFAEIMEATDCCAYPFIKAWTDAHTTPANPPAAQQIQTANMIGNCVEQ